MTEEQRTRFQHLWDRQFRGEALTETEQTELSGWIAVVEQAEADYLHPANARLQAAAESLEERNRALERLIHRKEALVAKLQQVAAEADAERTAINAEVRRLLQLEPKVAAGA